MKIEELINILNKSIEQRDGIEKVKILTKDTDDDYIFSLNDISGWSYYFKDNAIVLFPDYL